MRVLRTLLLSGVLLGLSGVTTGCVDKPTEHRVRANAYLRGGDAQKALEEIDKGLAQAKSDISLLILKGKALFELERYDDAKTAYEAAIAAAGDEKKLVGEAQLGLAMIAMRQKDWAEGRKRFQALVDLNPEDGDAQINLARVCLQVEDLECAVKHGEQAGHHRGNSEDVLFTLGRIYVAASKYDEAEKTFNRICEVVPNASSCPYGLALVAAQQGNADKAIAKLKEAVDKKLPNPDKLDEDPMLAPLKDNPAFTKLVSDAKGS